MHWKKLIEGCNLYNQQLGTRRYTLGYEPYDCLPGIEAIRSTEAKKLVKFMNSWGTRSPMTEHDLRRGIEPIYEDLQLLSRLDMAFLDLHGQDDQGRAFKDVIAHAFNGIAGCSPRRTESTGASKILHILIPRLFIMWDRRIAAGYGVDRDSHDQFPGHEYVRKFLPRVMVELEEALSTFQRDHQCEVSEAALALESLGGGLTIARMLDEFNYAKFTLSLDALWQRHN